MWPSSDQKPETNEKNYCISLKATSSLVYSNLDTLLFGCFTHGTVHSSHYGKMWHNIALFLKQMLLAQILLSIFGVCRLLVVFVMLCIFFFCPWCLYYVPLHQFFWVCLLFSSPLFPLFIYARIRYFVLDMLCGIGKCNITNMAVYIVFDSCDNTIMSIYILQCINNKTFDRKKTPLKNTP